MEIKHESSRDVVQCQLTATAERACLNEKGDVSSVVIEDHQNKTLDQISECFILLRIIMATPVTDERRSSRLQLRPASERPWLYRELPILSTETENDVASAMGYSELCGELQFR